ncbi:hypothetical protein [Nocardioides aequoreus]|uniref:hypothetical protein n=1 Tax=Nocardioides aequoreus TaxID=397278 RepID=UPI0004C4037C|nr:hypothetical protein [Nocardioides aequoreus]
MVVLDVPGTNQHRTWQDPTLFWPERFRGHRPSPFDLVPQGGGDVASGHRCPGESVTLVLLETTVRLLTSWEWRARSGPPDRRRIPTLPGGGLRILDVLDPTNGTPRPRVAVRSV